jgi:hypothetical protein
VLQRIGLQRTTLGCCWATRATARLPARNGDVKTGQKRNGAHRACYNGLIGGARLTSSRRSGQGRATAALTGELERRWFGAVAGRGRSGWCHAGRATKVTWSIGGGSPVPPLLARRRTLTAVRLPTLGTLPPPSHLLPSLLLLGSVIASSSQALSFSPPRVRRRRWFRKGKNPKRLGFCERGRQGLIGGS